MEQSGNFVLCTHQKLRAQLVKLAKVNTLVALNKIQ